MREYTIPHVKKSGRISIPEESVEEIRRARDLHREGMGTGPVRRMLRESTDGVPVRTDDEISTRLDRLAQELEGLRGDPRSLEEASSPHALRTILARQSLLISAVFNLTGMVEELMRAGGHQRRFSQAPADGDAYAALDRIALVRDSMEGELPPAAKIEGRPETRLARTRPVGSPVVRVPVTSRSTVPAQDRLRGGGEFGSLSRKRRRTTAVIAGVLVVVVLVVFGLLIAGAI